MKHPVVDTKEHAPRRPPAFQEYASDLMALERVKLMSLAERGLFATLRWYVWTNDSIPRDPKQIARLLGLDADEVRSALTDRVLSFFDVAGAGTDRLICGELSGQMKRLVDRRTKQAEGGRDGARARREKKFSAISTPQSTPVGSAQVPEKSRDEKSRDELRKGPDEIHPSIPRNARGRADPFVAAMEAAEADASFRGRVRVAGEH